MQYSSIFLGSAGKMKRELLEINAAEFSWDECSSCGPINSIK